MGDGPQTRRFLAQVAEANEPWHTGLYDLHIKNGYSAMNAGAISY